MSSRYLRPLVLFLLMMFVPLVPCHGEEPGSASETFTPVSEDLAIKVADGYAQERWPGCRYHSHVAYYALDGSVTAWAVQFAKPGAKVLPADQLVPLLMERAAVKKQVSLETEQPAAVKAAWGEIDPRDLAPTSPEAVSEPMQAPIMMPVDAVEQARLRSEAASLESSVYLHGREQASVKLREASRAASMADEIGTIVIAAREDLYPFLEAHSGVAAHLMFTEDVANKAGVPIDEVAEPQVNRVFYPSPMTYWLEPTGSAAKSAGVGADQVVDAESGDWIDLKAEQSSKGAGGMKNAYNEEVGVAPAAVWASIRQAEKSGDGVGSFAKTTDQNALTDVPYYIQSRYGRNSCGPTTFANLLGYWDTKGYGTLVDNGESLENGPGYEDFAVYYLMRRTGYDPTYGTWPDWDPIEAGIRQVCEDADFANFVDVQVYENTIVSYTNHIKKEIDAGRPLAFCWFIDGDLLRGHWVTIVAYNQTSGDPIFTVHNNWEINHPDGIELNLANIFPMNASWCERLHVKAEPFDCIWSEGWEASTPLYSTDHCAPGQPCTPSVYGYDYGDPSWQFLSTINGVPTADMWMHTAVRSHSTPNDPYPEHGAHSFSQRVSAPYTSDGGNYTRPYSPNTDAVMYYGPFSTQGRTSGEFRAMLALEIDDYLDDRAYLVASLDGTNWQGLQFTDPLAGNTSPWAEPFRGRWFPARLDLASVPGLGNLLNRERVWVGVYFHSDGDANNSQGMFVDNLSINLYPYTPEPFAFTPPSAPAASQGTYVGVITVTGDLVPGALYYRFYRFFAQGDPWRPISGWTQDRVFTDTTALSGWEYQYRYKVAHNPSGTNASILSLPATGWRGGRAPFNFTVTMGTYSDRITLNWTDGDNSHYSVERSTGSVAGPWTTVLPTTAGGYLRSSVPYHFTWSDTNATQGVDYYYRVRGKTLSTWSPYEGPKLGYLRLSPPTGVTAENRVGSVMLRWPSKPGRFYAVYARERGTAEPVMLTPDLTSSNEFFHSPVLPFGRYYYYYVVQALTQGGKATSEMSPYVEGYSIFETPRNLRASDGTDYSHVTVQWDMDPSAVYRVQRSDTGEVWSTVRNWSSETIFHDVTPTPGAARHYRVQAAANNTGFAASAYSTSDIGWRKLFSPVNVVATNGTLSGGVRVTWNSVMGAGAYRVSRFTSPTAPFGTLVSNWIMEREFLDTTAIPGVLYYYGVNAAADIQGSRSGPMGDRIQGSRAFAPTPSPSPTDVATPTASVTPMPTPGPGQPEYCTSPDLPLVGIGPINSGMVVGDNGAITDLDVRINLSHTYVGDVTVTLTHMNSGTAVTLIDRPGNPASPYGCSGDNILVTLDDEAGAPVEDACGADPAIAGSLRPNSPLSAFDGEDIQGVWRLTIADADGNTDDGNLNEWCLLATYAEPTPTPSPTPIEKLTQLPNRTDGNAIVSFSDGTEEQALAADDWECLDGLAIRRIKWWGSYVGYEADNPALLPPPDGALLDFVVSWHEVALMQTFYPGAIIAQETVTDYNETAVGVVHAQVGPNTFEYQHLYEYECTLTVPWDQVQGESYFLSIQATQPQGTGPTWGWFTSEAAAGFEAQQTWSPPNGWDELFYEPWHRLWPSSVALAFELSTSVPTPTPTPLPTPTLTPSPTPTVSPTATPSPSPTPGKLRCFRAPNTSDGLARHSWRTAAKDGGTSDSLRVADDWQTIDDWPLDRVRWWGSYEDYNPSNGAPCEPPTLRPNQFELRWSQLAEGPPFQPGEQLGTALSAAFTETWHASVERWDAPGSYLHIFEYELTLPTLWQAMPGQTYFLEIQAVYPSEPMQYPWGWMASDGEFNHAAVESQTANIWTELMWPAGHRLEGTPLNTAFEIWGVEVLPTPSPTPEPTPTPNEPPTPSPTPFGLTVNQQPNLIDGIDTISISDRSTTTSMEVADDVISDRTIFINSIIWWGSYPGWRSDTSQPGVSPASLDGLDGNLDRPNERPIAYTLRVYEPAESLNEPGRLIQQQDLPDWIEEWAGAVPRFGHPGSFEHEYTYTALTPMPIVMQADTRYFISIQARYAEPELDYQWGWLASTESQGAAAVTRTGSGAWSPLTWPVGHRLGGSMDMAFDLREGILPSPTPSPSPIPTPITTPSPTPVDWFSLHVTAENGYVGRRPDQAAYAPGTNVTLIPSGDNGHQFASWSGDVSPGQETTAPLEVTMDRNLTLTAHFALAPYTVTLLIDNGTATIEPQQSFYTFETIVTVEAHPSGHTAFVIWEIVEGDVPEEALRQNPLEFVVYGNVTLRAITTQGEVWEIY